MIEKVINSKNKALIKQKWQVGDLPIRLGHPYSYPDTGSKPFILDCDTFQGIYHYLSAYYVVKKTPKVRRELTFLDDANCPYGTQI